MDNTKWSWEIEYTNNAWGKQHKGTLLSEDGKVYRYDLSKVEEKGLFGASLQEKLAVAQIQPPINLPYEWLVAKSKCALTGKLSVRKRRGYDGGVTVYRIIPPRSFTAFTFSPPTTVLLITGDDFQQNTMPCALDLTKWLQENLSV